MRTFVSLLALGMMAVPGVHAQDEPAKLKVGAPVSVPVVVRDKKGGVVAGLGKANFTVKVDGTVQALSEVAEGKASTVTYGLVVDVSKGQRHALEAFRKGARALIGSLQPGDQMFVVQFARQIELLQGPTKDRAKLERALNLLGTSSPTFQPNDPPMERGTDSEGRRIRTGGVSLDDAIYLSSEEVLAREKTRRVLVVVSDGVDVGSKTSSTEVMESLERTGTLVYGVFSRNDVAVQQEREHNSGRGGNGRPSIGGYPGSYPGGGYPGGGYPGGGTGNGGGSNTPNPGSHGDDRPSRPHVDGLQALTKMSTATGGRLLDSTKREPLDEQLATVGGDLRSLYWLTFAPAGAAARNGYHPFDLEVSGSDKSRKVDIQTSDGYYAAN